MVMDNNEGGQIFNPRESGERGIKYSCKLFFAFPNQLEPVIRGGCEKLGLVEIPESMNSTKQYLGFQTRTAQLWT
jgi:hypothetical protein